MTGYFSLQPFSEDSLYKSFANDYCSAAEVASKSSCRYLFEYLLAIGTKTILVEPEYIDGDYLDDYSGYYVKCFTPFKRFCSRIHFFSSDFDEQFIRDAVSGQSAENIAALTPTYLGFTVARPLPEAIIGRTVLGTYPDDGGRRHYSCTRVYQVNLFGLRLKVNSLAFQEQDTVLAACATVALWSALHKTSELFGMTKLTPASITRAGTAYFGESRPTPSHGLNVHQLCNAVRSTGLEPEILSASPGLPLPTMIYSYLRAGIPVILGVKIENDFHAITLSGFSLRDRQAVSDEGSPEGLRMIGRRIDEFYAHDDQFGPFSKLQVFVPMVRETSTRVKVQFYGKWRDASENIVPLDPVVAVVPVYAKIRLTFVDVQKWLLRLDWLISLLPGTDNGEEWDVHIITTNELKSELLNCPELKGTAQLERLLFEPHPRFAWRAILSIRGVKVLELLADATGIARSFPFYEIIWHFDAFRTFLKSMLAIPGIAPLVENRLTSRFLRFISDSLSDAVPTK
jgi:hypothetical protein